MKTIGWIVKKLAFGFVALYAFNFVAAFIGIKIASHWLFYLAIGALGWPGLLVVYVTNVLLNL